MPSTVNVEAQLSIAIPTPLKLLGIDPCMMLCMLTIKIRISENPATKMTGLKIISSMTSKLRYPIIHFPPSLTHSLSLKRVKRMINGDPMINIRKNTTLMIFAIKSNASQRV